MSSVSLSGQIQGWRNAALEAGFVPPKISAFTEIKLGAGEYFFHRPAGNVGLAAQRYFEQQHRFFMGVDAAPFEDLPEFYGVVSSEYQKGAQPVSLVDRLWLERAKAANWKSGWRRTGSGSWFRTLITYIASRGASQTAELFYGQDSCSGPLQVLISGVVYPETKPLYVLPLKGVIH
jgi:hypothetical protein